MKLLIAFAAIITIVSAGDSNDFNDVDGPLAKQDVLKFTDGYFHSDDPNSWTAYVRRVAARLRRAANDDPLKTSVEKIQKISRLTNAIFLQKGLMNGSIDADILISELLHFGNVTPSKINEMDRTTLETSIKALEDLPGQIQETDGIKRLQKSFSIIDDILNEMPDVKNVSEWPGEQDFESDLKKLSNGTLEDNGILGQLENHASDYASRFRVVEKYNGNIDGSEYGEINQLKTAFEGFLSCGGQLTKEIPQVFRFTNKTSAADSFSYMIQVTSGVKKLIEKKNELSSSENDFGELNNSVSTIIGAASKVYAIAPHLQLIRDALSFSFGKHHSGQIKYTSGLSRGYADITQMFADFNDPWFSDVVRSGRLSDALKSLKPLGSSFNNIETSLKLIGRDEIQVISSVFDISSKLVKDFSQFSINKAKDVWTCVELIPGKFVSSQDIDDLATFVKNVDDDLQKIRDALVGLRAILNEEANQEILKDVIAICGELIAKNDSSLKNVLDKLSNYEKKDELKNFVKDVRNKMKDVKIDQIEKNAGELLTNMNKSLSGYRNQIAPYAPNLNCLLEKDYAKEVTNVVRESQSIRDPQSTLNPQKVGKVRQIVGSFLSTKSDLGTLKTIIKNIKGFKSVESDLLNLSEADKHSQVLGASTQGVVSMKKAIDTKSTADVIKQNADIVKIEVSAVKGLSAEDKNNLDRLESLGTSWGEMIAQLNTWKDGIKNSNSSTLADYAYIFLEAKKVNGVDDLEKISSSLSHLIDLVPGSSNKKQLEDIKKAVDELDEIGLQFAGYQTSFDESKKSLAALDLFFADFGKKNSVTVAPPITPQQQQPQVSLSTTVESVEPVRHDLIFRKNIWQVILITIAGFVSSLMAAPLVTVLMIRLRSCLLRRKFKKRGFRIRRRRRGRKVCGQKTVIVTWEQAVRHMREFKDKLSYWGQANPCTRGLNESDDDYNLRSNLFRRWSEHTFRQISFDYKENIQAGDVNTLSDFVMKHKDEWRKAVELNKNTNVILPTSKPGEGGVRFKTSFIHASRVRLEPNRQLILTQGPQIESKGKKSTMEKFWYLVKSEKARAVVMLCDFIEGDERKCDVYLPLKVGEVVQHGVYSIKCTRVVVNGSVTNRHLVLSQGKKNHGLSHFQYLGWPDKGVPKDCKELLNFWKIVRNMNTNTIIHCSAGIGRSGTLAYIEKLYQAIYNSPKAAHQSLLTALRGERARSVQSESQFAFAIYSVFKLMFMKFERKKTKKAPNTMNKSVDKTKKSVEGTNKKSVDRKKKKVEKIPQEKPKEIAEVKEFLKSLEDDWKVILKVCAGGKELAKKEKNLKIEGDLVEVLRKKDAKEKSETARKEKEINGGKGEKVKVDKKATGDKNVQKKGDKGKQDVKAKSKEMGQKDVKEKEQGKKDVKGKSKEQAKKAGK